MKLFLVIGVDVSKLSLDIYFKPSGFHLKISNDVNGFKIFFQQLEKLLQQEMSVMVVMEHTGKYSVQFEKFLRNKSVDYCKISALQIKRSLGMIRGKNDRVDAQRIAEYGWLRKEILTADDACVKGIERLKELMSLRSKLVRDRSGFICRLKEIDTTLKYSKKDPVVEIQKKYIAALTTDIKKVEQCIDDLINENSALKQTNDLLRSIKGVGKIIAAYMISCTNNFRRFTNARKFNCYAGLAPFKSESGTSIKSRARISHLANKEAKTLLNLAASCAINHDQELKAYYDRRVSEGMRKMSCLNIIRSKIVGRIFAVVKRQTPFIPAVAA